MRRPSRPMTAAFPNRALAFLLFCFLPCSGLSGEAAAPFDEVAVKAGFLFNFAQFVDWPPAPGPKPFEFCVVGDPPIADYLRLHLAGKSLGLRPVLVRIRETPADLATCDMIYLGRSQKKNMLKYAQAVAGQPVLLVSEFPEFGDKGVAINFFFDEQRIRFEVHLRAVRQSGLNIRSRLLSLARVVGKN